MKNLLIAALVIFTIAALASLPKVAAGGPSASATVRVTVTVASDIAVTPLDATMDAGVIRTGPFSISCNYQVRANMQNVQLFVEQSPLFKAGDPTGRVVAPIPVDTSKGVTIQPAGSASSGGAHVLTFVGSGATVDGYPTLKTELGRLSSSKSAVFNEQVGVTCWWSQADAQKPPGEYSGVVRLTTLTMPPQG